VDGAHRRLLALWFAAAAAALAVALVVMGLACGARSVSESCTTAEECTALSKCESRVHPFAVPYFLAGAGAFLGAWYDRRAVALGIAVPALGLGVLAGFSLGLYGIAIASLLLASGAATPPARRGDAALLVAALLGVPWYALAMVALTLAPPSLRLASVWAIAAVPTVVWFATFAWTRTRARGVPA